MQEVEAYLVPVKQWSYQKIKSEAESPIWKSLTMTKSENKWKQVVEQYINNPWRTEWLTTTLREHLEGTNWKHKDVQWQVDIFYECDETNWTKDPLETLPVELYVSMHIARDNSEIAYLNWMLNKQASNVIFSNAMLVQQCQFALQRWIIGPVSAWYLLISSGGPESSNDKQLISGLPGPHTSERFWVSIRVELRSAPSTSNTDTIEFQQVCCCTYILNQQIRSLSHKFAHTKHIDSLVDSQSTSAQIQAPLDWMDSEGPHIAWAEEQFHNQVISFLLSGNLTEIPHHT